MFKETTATADYMSVVVTHECNRKCPFCVDQYRGRKEYMTPATVEKAVVTAWKKQIRDILLVGGEPTMHPNIVRIARYFREAGFNVVMTTNYSRPDVVKALDPYVNSFNISWYGQKELPKQNDFTADLTLSALIFAGQLDTKEKLDAFIDAHSDLQMKFSTLTPCNDFCQKAQQVDYLDELEGRRMVLFGELLGQEYRGYIIKRCDRVLNQHAPQSLKVHVDGEISRSWTRKRLEKM